jgi:DNA polymerase-3 subunit alpha
MGAIKGVGEGVVQAIVEEREKKGMFSSLFDFIRRIDTKRVGKKAIELLIQAGCFDFTKWSRGALLASVDAMHAMASKEQKDAARGVIDLFASSDSQEETQFQAPPSVEAVESKQQILRREKELLGFYLTGHPLDEYRSLLKRLSCVPLAEIGKMDQDAVCRIAFIADTVQVKVSGKTQRKFAILTIGDGIERFELPIWSDLFETKAPLLVENQLLYAVVQIDKKEGELRLQCRWLDDLTQANEAMIVACDAAFDQAKAQVRMSEFRQKAAAKVPARKEIPKKMCLKIDIDQMRLSHILEIKKIFRSRPGTTPISLEFYGGVQRVGTLHVDSSWGVAFDRELEEKLKGFPSITLTELQNTP